MRILCTGAIMLWIAGCAEIAPEPFTPSAGHIDADVIVDREPIPEIVQQAPVLPEPEPPVELEKYTVVVNEVPVGELLFALARDAQINVDIDPRIEGVVTINAVEQTLPQLLNRIARQVNLRYEFDQNNLIIMPDVPFFRTYTVGYLNLSRDTIGTVSVSTQIASASSGGVQSSDSSGGENTSLTSISSESSHRFWENLNRSIAGILSGGSGSSRAATDNLVINPESGIVSVFATARQHEEIQILIDQIMESVQRQVLIKATVVEVDLSDQYQAGIDWQILQQEGAGWSASSSLLGVASGGLGLTGPPATSSFFVLDYFNPDSQGERISATVSLLSEFGNTRVLSSPQIMVLNNHTAVLKVVENFVYFEIEQELEPSNVLGGQASIATTTTARTVPVGLVMTVTPQISGNDSVTLNVRPTISNVVRTVEDPNPVITISNRIPVIRVREMESILRVNSNQVAVLGGLMQDTFRDNDRKTPFAGDLPIIGNLFKSKDRESLKTELVIFLQPIVIRNASLEGDLKEYRGYLESTP